MPNPQGFIPGDVLIFQLESGFGLLRLLAFEEPDPPIWLVRAYSDLFLDIESAEDRAMNGSLTVGISHIALTDRAFESTQVSKLANRPLEPELEALVDQWANAPDKAASDRSIRLHLGLR